MSAVKALTLLSGSLLGSSFSIPEPLTIVVTEPLTKAFSIVVHGTRAAGGVGHAREGFPHVGSKAEENDLGIEGTMVEIEKVGDFDELVIFGEGVEAKFVVGTKEAYVVVVTHKGVTSMHRSCEKPLDSVELR
ncbi:hypothetical protein RJT34_12124 [Clitoria ternatea]|uniref:Uncharacterized protein n=1 Tax=Clitoria ternatea TaxID=43366 RepID=A0AAN9PKD1_CLITE